MILFTPMLLWALQYFLAHAAPSKLDVFLNTGIFRGVTTPNGTEKWLGIPFAEAPVGPLRFKAPVPIKFSPGIQDASSFGNVCPQPPPAGNLGAPIGEDCLFLNVYTSSSRFNSLILKQAQVWRPQNTTVDSKLPVLFWIHVSIYACEVEYIPDWRRAGLIQPSNSFGMFEDGTERLFMKALLPTPCGIRHVGLLLSHHSPSLSSCKASFSGAWL
jgi:hypothetical protein